MNAITSAEVVYGVRYTIPGEDEQITEVGSPCLGDELIRDLWFDHGVTGKPVRHYVTPWEEM